MNLYFRLLFLILTKLWRRPAVHPLHATHLDFTCLPLDCDYNLHMTNSRFSSFCDLARIGAMFDMGVLVRLVKDGYTPIVTAQNVMHFREIQPLRSFSVHSRIIGWGDRFWFFQHDFIQGGSLKATVIAKGFFVCRRKVVPFSTILNFSGLSLTSPELPDWIQQWSAGCDLMFRAAGQR